MATAMTDFTATADNLTLAIVEEQPLEVQPIEMKPDNREAWRSPADFAAAGLKQMANPAADRRTLLLATLSNLKNRRSELEEQLLNVQIQEEEMQKEVKMLTEFLDSCSYIGELSRSVEALVKCTLAAQTHPSKAKQSDRAPRRRLALGEADFTSEDCLRIFEQNPNITLSMDEVVAQVHPLKRDAARVSMSQRAGYLCAQGAIKRVTPGYYRYETATAQPQAAQQEEQTLEPPVEIPVLRSKDVLKATRLMPPSNSTTAARKGRPPGKRNIPPSTVGEPLSGLPHLRPLVVVPARPAASQPSHS